MFLPVSYCGIINRVRSKTLSELHAPKSRKIPKNGEGIMRHVNWATGGGLAFSQAGQIPKTKIENPIRAAKEKSHYLISIFPLF